MIVAPYVGAWIETESKDDNMFGVIVAPYVGAWIETGDTSSFGNPGSLSHPMWVRGLKRNVDAPQWGED